MPTHQQIMISVEVKDQLRNQGRAGESFDTVLRRLLGMEPKKRKDQNEARVSNVGTKVCSQ